MKRQMTLLLYDKCHARRNNKLRAFPQSPVPFDPPAAFARDAAHADLIEPGSNAPKQQKRCVQIRNAPYKTFSDRLLVPMDSRTTAGPSSTDEYVFYREGGWSWSIPYIAGVYALVAQVKPAITPEEFWRLALQTGQTIELNHKGEIYSLRSILDPVALMAALHK
ncbi:MAG: hypothetical protein WC837_00520 [Bellilinea sp.]